MKILSAAHQALLSQDNAESLIAGVEAAGICISRTNGGFAVSDDVAAIAVLTTESAWLPRAKLVKLGALSDKLDSIIAAGRIIGAKTYQIDDASRTAMQNAYNNTVWPIDWIAIDNSIVNLTQAQFQAGARNVDAYYRAMKLNARTLKSFIQGAASYAVLQGIDINSGWPANP
jgi:hypothetical protein